MAIVAVASDLQDLRRRLGAITVARTFDGEAVTAEQLRAAGAMTVLLKDTIKPNLVQTLEGQPALIHCGPFANIAHGNNSLVADRVALKLGDYVVTESGFGSDMGMEKFFDIVCRAGDLKPSAVVLVATVKALKHHAGDPDGGARQSRPAPRTSPDISASSASSASTPWSRSTASRRHDEEIELVRKLAIEQGAYAAEVNDGFEQGGAGAAALAEAVVAAADEPSNFDYVYPIDAPIEQKIEAIAKRVYGADGIFLLKTTQDKIEQFNRAGLDGCRSAWRRRTSPCPTTRRSRTRRPDSRSRFETSGPTPARAGSSRSAATCRRCRATARIRRPSTSTSTTRAGP